MDIEELFESNKELSEDEVVMIFHNEGELSLKECQSEYKRLATIAGLIKSPNQRKAEWEDTVEGLDLSSIEGVNEAKANGSTLGITATTTAKYIKNLALELGVELPVITATRSNPVWNNIIDSFTEDEAINNEREDVIAKINDVGNYDDIKKAGSYYNKLRKHFGWEAPASMSSQLCDWYKDQINNGDKVTSTSIVEKSLEIGMTEGSGKYYVGVFKLAGEIIETLDK